MGYTPRHKPFEHQLTALERCRTKPDDPADSDSFAYLMEQGTGKTKTILDEFGAREDARDLRNLLVIAPKGVYMNWVNTEIPEHLSDDLRERTAVCYWQSGANKTHQQRLAAFMAKQDRPRILVVNVEALSVVQEAVDLCDEFIHQRRCMAVVDESTRIKGLAEKTARANAVIQLGERAHARRIATGLVTPRSPFDLFSQFQFLDWRILGYASFYAFKNRYGIIKKETFGGKLKRNADGTLATDANGECIREGARKVDLVVGYRNETELRDKIAPYSYRVLKEDCLDLPAKIYMPPRDVELTDEQRRVLKDLKNTMTAQLDNGHHVSTTIKLTQLMRMHQVICGHVTDENGGLHRVKSNRLGQLMEVLDEHAGKAIIWSGFVPCIEEIIAKLREEYGPQSVVHYYGKTKDNEREMAKVRFQRDPSCRFFVANPSTAGMGLTLHAASLVVFYSNNWNLEDRMQAEDRAHRAGLKHPVTYIDLMAPGTMEKRLIQALRDKLDIATLIQGDSYREWIV